MSVLGMSAGMIALFVVFGFLVGILFGFFGMGGSFLVTPALLIFGFKSTVAVGSGMAFVFGTSVIATLKHRDLGQVDYKLGVLMILGTATGIEVGKDIVVSLQEMGLAGRIISAVYVLLLGGIGLFVTREALKDGDEGPSEADAEGEDFEDHEVPAIAKKVEAIRIPPMFDLRGGIQVSLWVILAVAFATGLLSGLLGVGGGFIRMPALFYLFGLPVPVAVGTDLFGIMFSGGIGSFLYAQLGGVKLGIVVPLLSGSALGARLGSAATSIVDEDEIKVYFGIMLLLGSVAVAMKEIGKAYGVELLRTASIVVILGAAVLVAGAVVYSSLKTMREPTAVPSTAD